MATATSTTNPMLHGRLMHEKPAKATIKTQTKPTIPHLDGPQVRIVQPHEYKQAAACLAEAFRLDHVVRYSIDTPDHEHLTEQERFEIHKSAMEYVTYAHILQGLVLTVGDDYACVALWLPPGKNIDGWMTALRSGLWRLAYKLSKEGKTRFFDEFIPLLSRTKLEILEERDKKSWYLNYIGTKPEGRGRGYARKLIEHVTKMADAEGVPCYLESSHDVNLIIYGKMGFELRKQIFLKRDAGGELRMDVMVREPAGTKETDHKVETVKIG